MSSKFIMIELPEEIGQYEDDLKELWEAQVAKLHKNRHKKSVEHYDVPYLMGRLLAECAEVLEQYHVDILSPNMKLELADVMNFAFLMWIAVKGENGQSTNG